MAHKPTFPTPTGDNMKYFKWINKVLSKDFLSRTKCEICYLVAKKQVIIVSSDIGGGHEATLDIVMCDGCFETKIGEINDR